MLICHKNIECLLLFLFTDLISIKTSVGFIFKKQMNTTLWEWSWDVNMFTCCINKTNETQERIQAIEFAITKGSKGMVAVPG